MSPEKLEAAKEAYKDKVNSKDDIFIIFCEDYDGTINMHSDISDEKYWMTMFPENGSWTQENYKAYHLCSYNERRDELIWKETFDVEGNQYHISVDIDDDVFLTLAKNAHEKDITFNQLVINLLQQYIDKQVKIK